MDLTTYAQLAFWNVGQGNCTLIKSPVLTDNKRSLWIIDAGTYSGNPRKNWDFNNKNVINTVRLQGDIQNWIIGKDEDEKFITANFVVSHPDKDHFSLVNSIRDIFSDEVKCRLFVGKEYSDLNLYPSLIAEQYEVIPIDGQASYNWNGELADDSIISFLNDAGRDPTTKEKNHNSLIVLVKYGILSFLLTGDATTKTYEKSSIYKGTIDWSKLHTILQVSHHGSGKDGCTSPALLKAVKPCAFVISAPLVVGSHDHPKNSVIQHIVTHCKDYPGGLCYFHGGGHFICSNDETNDITQICRQYPPPSVNNNDLVLVSQFNTNTTPPEQKDLCVTKLPIFTTGSNGTIIWVWNQQESTKYLRCIDNWNDSKEIFEPLTTFYPDNKINETALDILTTVRNNRLAPLNFRLVLDYDRSGSLELIRQTLGYDNMVALDLRSSKVKKYWTKQTVFHFLIRFPKLQAMAMDPSGDQMHEDYGPRLTKVEKRFHNI